MRDVTAVAVMQHKSRTLFLVAADWQGIFLWLHFLVPSHTLPSYSKITAGFYTTIPRVMKASNSAMT